MIYKMKFLLILFLLTMFPSTAFGQLNVGQIMVDGKLFSTVTEAQLAITDNSRVHIGPGSYSEGIKILADDVILSGQEGTHFNGAVVDGKATFVVSGKNTLIENIECSGVAVKARNGACVRHQGKNLTLLGVHFHDSQQGVLTTSASGDLIIKYSVFENLGFAGRAHAIYANGEKLVVERSRIINSVDQGHEIKSRAKTTEIRSSIVGSIATSDSRALDIPHGGILHVENSIILQNKNTVNRQLIGYGLEGLGRKREHKIHISNNLFILEREKGNELLALENDGIVVYPVSVYSNAIVGRKVFDVKKYETDNRYFESRRAAGLAESELPSIAVMPYLLNKK